MTPHPERFGSEDAPAGPAVSEDMLSRVLGRRPVVKVSDDFARRVTRHVLAQPRRHTAGWLGWGPRVAIGSAVLLTAGMFALAPHVTPSPGNLAFDGELLLLAELSGLLLFSRRLLQRD